MRVINLLPKTRQEELDYDAISQGFYSLIVLSLCSFAIVFLAQFGVKFYLESRYSSVQSSIALLKTQVNKNDNAQLKAQITQINNIIFDYNNLASSAPQWSRIIKAFAPLPPPGVQINSFTVNAAAKTVLITGFSPTREGVIQVYNNILADSKDFYKIDYPFENVAQAKNVAFHFSFSIQDALFTNQP